MFYFCEIIICIILIILSFFTVSNGQKVYTGGENKTEVDTNSIENMKHIHLFDFYNPAINHPIELYKRNIFIIGHIAGPTASGKTTLGEKIQKECPDIIVKDLDEFTEGIPYSEQRIYTLRDKMTEFILSNTNKLILFVGHNFEGNVFIDIPGYLSFLNISLSQLLEQYINRNKNMNITLSSEDIIKYIQISESDKKIYNNCGYFKPDFIETFETISWFIVPNFRYKLNNKNKKPIIHISGQSGSGKTTLLKRLIDEAHLNAIDLDEISDLSQSKYTKDMTFKEKFAIDVNELYSVLNKYNIYIGLSVLMVGLTDYTFYIKISIDENYRRVTKRTVESICKNSDSIFSKFKNGIEANMQDIWEDVTRKYEIRGPALPPFSEYIHWYTWFDNNVRAMGYIESTPDKLINICTQLEKNENQIG